MMIVSKRYQGERHYITEFVQPNNAAVVELAAQIARMPGDFVLNCLKWVRHNIEYPQGQGGNADFVDWHYFEAFRVYGGDGEPVALEKRWATDFWQFPAETISLRVGDCDCGAILLCSLLRTRIPAEDVYVTIGRFGSEGHAWVTYRGVVLESSTIEPTTDENEGVYEETRPYFPTMRFNDQLVA